MPLIYIYFLIFSITCFFQNNKAIPMFYLNSNLHSGHSKNSWNVMNAWHNYWLQYFVFILYLLTKLLQRLNHFSIQFPSCSNPECSYHNIENVNLQSFANQGMQNVSRYFNLPGTQEKDASRYEDSSNGQGWMPWKVTSIARNWHVGRPEHCESAKLANQRGKSLI